MWWADQWSKDESLRISWANIGRSGSSMLWIWPRLDLDRSADHDMVFVLSGHWRFGTGSSSRKIQNFVQVGELNLGRGGALSAVDVSQTVDPSGLLELPEQLGDWVDVPPPPNHRVCSWWTCSGSWGQNSGRKAFHWRTGDLRSHCAAGWHPGGGTCPPRLCQGRGGEGCCPSKGHAKSAGRERELNRKANNKGKKTEESP